jgi:thioredoxin reductase (NADPH)
MYLDWREKTTRRRPAPAPLPTIPGAPGRTNVTGRTSVIVVTTLERTLMVDILIIGAGPAGISMAVEARSAGVDPNRVLVLEKAPEHSFSLKKYYPEDKLVTANYKGFEAVCTGVMCMPNLSKSEAISYLDRTLRHFNIHVRYEETVHRIFRHEEGHHFTVSTEKGEYDTRIVVIAIGILGKPNKPAYQLPRTLRNRLLFDVTGIPIENAEVLVVGGGDSASEYVQYLVQRGNRVTLSYRRSEFTRMNDVNLESVLALATRRQATILYDSDIEKVTDAGGRPEVHFKGEASGTQTYDFVVYALGGSTPDNFLKTIGIEYNGDAPHLQEGYETSVPGMFLVGDLSAGTKGGSIIWAFNSANTAMRKILKDYLTIT